MRPCRCLDSGLGEVGCAERFENDDPRDHEFARHDKSWKPTHRIWGNMGPADRVGYQ